MASLVSSVGNMVEAGVKGLMGLAETYYSSEDEDGLTPRSDDNGNEYMDGDGKTIVEPVPIRPHEHESSNTSNNTTYSTSNTSSTTSSSIVSKPMIQGALVQILDVPSGWIHLQSTYLDGSGARKIRSFGLKNLSEREVEVIVQSDLDHQILFWTADDEPTSSSASSVSSSSNSPGTPTLRISVPGLATIAVHLSFQPSKTDIEPVPRQPSPTPSDGGFTPRIQSTSTRAGSLDVSPVPSINGQSDSASSAGGSTSGQSTSNSTTNSNSNLSVGNSQVRASSQQGRKTEPIHRSFSVHGSISIQAIESSDDAETPMESRPGPPASTQVLNLPFFATVCRSLFTAALIDPSTGLASGSQLSSGQLLIDFGGDPVVGNEYYRDILLVNRSEIELVWNTAVVNSRSKNSVWFSLRDLDSENVFGVDHSSQPVPLPALSSRHLRLELHVKAPVTDFDFDFVLSNMHQSGNTVTCRATGSGQAEGSDDSLKIVSGNTLDFGQINDGSWAKKMMTCKNAGDRPLDVHFSATPEYEVAFRLAGVAGDDMDEDLSMTTPNEKKGRPEKTADTSRKDPVASLRSTSRPSSPSKSHDQESSIYTTSDGPSVSDIMFKQLTGTKSEPYHGGPGSVTSMRDPSRPPSRALSRVTSRTSSHRYHSSVESDEEEEIAPPFFRGEPATVAASASAISPQRNNLPDTADRTVPNQIEEITMRPGTEYRIFVLYRSARDTTNPPEIAGALRQSSFKVHLESAPSGSRAAASPRFKRTVNCIAESCTSVISLTSGAKIDFGEVTVGASKSSTLCITNQSALSARVEIAAISKVLNTNRNVIIIPPHETVEEKIEFFPRRINDKYEKQMFVRNLLNRANDQLVEIKSKNVDVHNLTLHSHLYRILTPSGSNFLDFASVVINTPTVRTVLFENLSSTSSLLLELSASQPEDVELFLKAEDAPVSTLVAGKYDVEHTSLARVTSPPNGELKERFMETMRELSGKETTVKPSKHKGKTREKSSTRAGEDAPKQSVGAAVAAALKKGGRGRPVQLYGNAVVFKDRNLLENHEYLDLAAGPPISAHRTSPRSKKSQLLDSIEFEDKSKLSGQHPKIPKLDFAASAKATGLLKKEVRHKKPKQVSPSTPTKVDSIISSSFGAVAKALLPVAEVVKSPALTAKRADPKVEMSNTTEINKMTADDLLLAIEQHDLRRASIIHSTLEEEEAFVRRSISLRKELAALTASGKLVSARNISIPPGSDRQLIVVMTPNGSTRPHITTRAKRADSRVYIKLLDFDRSKLSNANTDLADLPVRDLIIRSSCVRSVLEVQQSSINFGTCEKGEVKSKTIVIHNKSDAVGLFRLRTSGSIASGDLKLGLGRYGVISAFGRKEVENFSFTPSLSGTYNENIVVENVLDTLNDQNVAVKANVRKAPTFTIEPPLVDFGMVDSDPALPPPAKMGFTLTNVSKHERTFVIGIKPDPAPPSGVEALGCFVDISLSRDDVGTALSKTEEEEIENITQKLRIARRKKKKDKVAKYESRFTELGVPIPADAEGDDAESNTAASDITSQPDNAPPPTPGQDTTENDADVEVEYGPRALISTLTVVLQPNQKNRIFVELLPKSPHLSQSGGDSDNPESDASSTTKEAQSTSSTRPSPTPLSNSLLTPLLDLDSIIEVHEKKNADESQSVKVIARQRPPYTDITSAAMASHNAATGVQSSHQSSVNSGASSNPSTVLPTSTDAVHTAAMRHCLELTHQCVVSPTAFCVASLLLLPASSPHYAALAPHFPRIIADSDSAGLILSEGYSRQIPGNTHAEANALTNFQSKLLQLQSSADFQVAATAENRALPTKEEILKDVECYATMEPCSIRTSGGPSCATELVKAGVKRVWLGVEEPPDFVQCQGVNVLLEGGVEVGRVAGLEDECLKAARRGRD